MNTKAVPADAFFACCCDIGGVRKKIGRPLRNFIWVRGLFRFTICAHEADRGRIPAKHADRCSPTSCVAFKCWWNTLVLSYFLLFWQMKQLPSTLMTRMVWRSKRWAEVCWTEVEDTNGWVACWKGAELSMQAVGFRYVSNLFSGWFLVSCALAGRTIVIIHLQ